MTVKSDIIFEKFVKRIFSLPESDAARLILFRLPYTPDILRKRMAEFGEDGIGVTQTIDELMAAGVNPDDELMEEGHKKQNEIYKKQE